MKPTTAARRTLHYALAMARSLQPRYLIAYSIARCLPLFSAGPIVARVYRAVGFRVGRGATFMGPLRLVGDGEFCASLTIGDDVVIATDITINLDAVVAIGDRASIGPFVRIYTATHQIGPGSRRMSSEVFARPVSIGRGAWIGIGATVLPGVTVGDGAVVAAGCVVTEDVPPNVFVEGIPARQIRALPWGDR